MVLGERYSCGFPLSFWGLTHPISVLTEMSGSNDVYAMGEMAGTSVACGSSVLTEMTDMYAKICS